MLDPKTGMGTYGGGAAEGPVAIAMGRTGWWVCCAQRTNVEIPELSKPAASTGWAEVQDRACSAPHSTGGTLTNRK